MRMVRSSSAYTHILRHQNNMKNHILCVEMCVCAGIAQSYAYTWWLNKTLVARKPMHMMYIMFILMKLFTETLCAVEWGGVFLRETTSISTEMVIGQDNFAVMLAFF